MPSLPEHWIEDTEKDYQNTVKAIESWVKQLTGEDNPQVKPTTHETKLKVDQLKEDDPPAKKPKPARSLWQKISAFASQKGRR